MLQTNESSKLGTGNSVNTCIVVPCYNEEPNLKIEDYQEFLIHSPHALICFVDDGSNDRTGSMLTEVERSHTVNVKVITLEKNVGKAEAVRQGILYCNENYNHTLIGFLDADLATPLSEFVRVSERLVNGISFAFGSRIRILGSEIDRTAFRFYTGRAIASIISNLLGLNVYDTQCGCKVFSRQLSVHLFRDQFVSRWLFDVELFFKVNNLYGKKVGLEKMEEVPLKKWIHTGNSKIKLSYFFKLWIDLIKIRRKYKVMGAGLWKKADKHTIQ